MREFIFVLLTIITMLRAMDAPIEWDPNMCNAATLLQGTGEKGCLDTKKIKEIASLIGLAKKQEKCLVKIHNSPCHLVISPAVPASKLYDIVALLRKFEGKFYIKTDNSEIRYEFAPETDVVWIAKQVSEKWGVQVEAKPFFPPKIRLTYGPAGADIINLRFINLDKRQKYYFTFQNHELIGSGNRPHVT